MAELTLKFSTLSRNAIIKECINAYVLNKEGQEQEIYELQRIVNALHIQLNPDWKRKKSLPYHDEQLYKIVANYAATNKERRENWADQRNGIGNIDDLPPNGGDE